MFSFLEVSRLEEQELEEIYQRLKDEGGKPAQDAFENMYNVQKSNAIRVKEMIDDYQPAPFARAWGNDSDYLSISNKLKSALMSDEPVNLKSILRSAKNPKKLKKKKVKT